MKPTTWAARSARATSSSASAARTTTTSSPPIKYGYTSYLRLLTQLQLAFGPAPYGIRLLNALLFTGGAAILFRLVRSAFGAIPAFGGLLVVLFLPSVFYASVSLLKESLYSSPRRRCSRRWCSRCARAPG